MKNILPPTKFGPKKGLFRIFVDLRSKVAAAEKRSKAGKGEGVNLL